MKKVELYTKDGCGQCQLLKQWLGMKKVTYSEVNVSHNEPALELLQSRGMTSLPRIAIADEFINYSEFIDILNYL